MKILQVIPYFYPAWKFGGPVSVAYSISKELVERGHFVTVYTSDIVDEKTRVDNTFQTVDGVDVFYFKNLSLYAAKRKMFITPSLVSAVKDNVNSFDIVHIHGNRTSQSLILHYFLKKNSVPYIVQAHGGLPRISGNRLTRLYDLFFGYNLLRKASKVVALSRVEVEQYVAMGVPEEKTEIIPNGIDLSEYTNLPPEGSFKNKFGIGDDEKIVLYVGRIHESKGLGLLAHAFKIVSETVSNVRFVIVGPDDGYASEFSRLISGLGLEEKVLLAGFVEKRDKLAAFVDGDVFVTPRFYGFPVTFLESCLAGCPIVTASNELDWINNNVGYVTEYFSGALAKAITTLLQDEQINRRFRNNCRRMIKDYDISTVTHKLENLYKAVADQSF
ncbi:MAG: glycosyltransferase [archaeon]